MNSGSLVYADYIKLLEKKIIINNKYNLSQIQPSLLIAKREGKSKIKKFYY